MLSFSSPKNYNELLPKLNQATFYSTLAFFIFLRVINLLPVVKIDEQLIPPIKDYTDTIEWLLSFGIIPILAALLALFFSQAFEMHNKIAKVLRLRYIWDKHFIIKPLLNAINLKLDLTPMIMKQIMNELYYPQTKKIDQHYVELFWRYALPFWILFEHSIVVLVSLCVLTIFYANTIVLYLWGYLISIIIVASVQLVFVTAQKSTDQVKQISVDVISEYFQKAFPKKESN